MKIIDCVQGTPEWFDARKGVPSASSFSKIITPAKGELSKSADRYIHELIGERMSLMLPEYAENYTNKAIRWGQQCEAEARRWYEMECNMDVAQVGFCLSDDGRFGCSPDGLVGEEGLLELKCPQADTQAKYLMEGTLPDDYKPQVHGQLIVTGRAWVDFVSYHPGMPPFKIRVCPGEFTAKLALALDVFWESYQKAWEKVSVM